MNDLGITEMKEVPQPQHHAQTLLDLTNAIQGRAMNPFIQVARMIDGYTCEVRRWSEQGSSGRWYFVELKRDGEQIDQRVCAGPRQQQLLFEEAHRILRGEGESARQLWRIA